MQINSKLDVFQVHRNTILAVSAIAITVSAFAIGYFAAQGAILFLTPGIPLSLCAVGATAFFITALIKQPPQIVETRTILRQQKHAEDNNSVDEDEEFYDALETPRNNRSPQGEDEANDAWRATHTQDAMETLHQNAMHHHTDINSLEELQDLGMPFIELEAATDMNQVMVAFKGQILDPLFESGIQVYTNVIKLYAKTYRSNEDKRLADVTRLVNEWKEAFTDKMGNPDDFVWIALDSAFATDAREETSAYRSGEKTGADILELMKCKAYAICDRDHRFDALITKWGQQAHINLEQQFTPTDAHHRTAFVEAFNQMEEQEKGQLAWLFCSIIHRRLNNDLLARWDNIVYELNDTQGADAKTLTRLNWLPNDSVLNETFCSVAGKFMATKIEAKIREPLQDTPIVQYVPKLIEIAQVMMLPLICGKCPNSKFHPVLLEATNDPTIIEAQRQNLMAFTTALNNFATGQLA